MPAEPIALERPRVQARPSQPGQRSPACEPLGFARSVLVAMYLAVALWYLSWRPSTFNDHALTFSIVVYAAELLGFAITLMHLFMVWRLSVRAAPAAAPNVTVDVFVPTLNEPLDMLRRTLQAAIRMDHPHQTWLLDDGNRPDVAALAQSLGCRYLARTENTDAKAGNLNHALAHSTAELVAIFDADHAPSPAFLTRTLGYFTDAQVAFVQTPQDFYNLDSYQHRYHSHRRLVWTEQSLFFRVIQRGKDYWNAAFLCGSCAIVRRKALDAVGGFATGTVTEDLQTSIRLHRKGFKSIYHAESLAFGVAPVTVVPFIRQRVRWGQGAMQALRRPSDWLGAGLSLPQRICYLATMLSYFDGWQKLVFYAAPVIVLMTGVMPIAEISWQFLAHFLPFYVLTFCVFEEVSRGYGRSISIEQYNMARFAAFLWATLRVLRRRFAFRVTTKQRVPGEQPRRWIAPQAAVLLLSAVAIPIGVLVTWKQGRLPTGALIANVVWAGVNLALAYAVVSFTSRVSASRRQEYRFPVPIPALLEFPEHAPVVGVLDDVSPLGFKFYGRFPAQTAIGTRIRGELYLPAGRVPVMAEVRARVRSDPSPASHTKALGCSFQWRHDAHKEALEAYLFGSNLQWRMNELGEQTRTPLEWMSGELAWRKRGRNSRPERWACVLSRLQEERGSTPEVGLVSVPLKGSGGRTLVSYRELPDAASLRLDVITRAGVHTLIGPAYFVDTIATAGRPLHLYRFETRDQVARRAVRP